MDIVERLRHHKSSDVWTERKNRTWYETDDLCMEAADEIERLREEIAFLKERALENEETVYQRGYVDGVADGYEEAKKRMTHERNN